MNSACPECNTELDEDFGIVTCKSCGAVCSVDLDGSVVVQKEESLAEVDAEDSQEDLLLEEVSSFSHEEDSHEEDSHEEDSHEKDLHEKNSNEEDSHEEGEDPSESLLIEDNEANEGAEGFDLTTEEPPHVGDDVLSEDVSSGTGSGEVLSSQSFFQGLDLFVNQLDDRDHFHTFFDLVVSGFDTKKDLTDLLELALDDRLEVTRDKVFFDDLHQRFRIGKISFLRLVNLHKRLSTLHFVKLDWLLSDSPKAQTLAKEFVSPLKLEETGSTNLDFSDETIEESEGLEELTQEAELSEEFEPTVDTEEPPELPPSFDDLDAEEIKPEEDF